jgi:hypothetical protein
MFSPWDSQVVLDDLGDKLPHALMRATDLARQDYAELRSKFPSWVPRFFERDAANVIHPRIWAHLEDELDGVDGITLVSREPHRQINLQTSVGRTYTMRVKRHSQRDRIRSYPTLSDVRFWSGGVRQQTIEGLECINLAIGYRWHKDRREIGAAVISYREGKDNVIWAYTIDEGMADGGTPFTYTPILPDLPQIDLRDSQGSRAEMDER